jgi:polyhydroxybutyrate depolymerase
VIAAALAVLVAAGTLSAVLLVADGGGHIDPALAVDVTGTTGTHGVVALSVVQKAATDATVSVRTVEVHGLTRAYVVIAPVSPIAKLPLLMVLQGVDASTTLEIQRDELVPLVSQGKAIVVYPVAYGESWNVGVDGCCKQAAKADVDDQDFVRTVTETVLASEPVDPAQVHLVGFSNGAKLGFQVLCDQPDLFADYSFVTAVPLAACTNSSQPAKSVLLTINSADDDLPETGESKPVSTLYPKVLETWRTRNGCTGEPVVTAAPPVTTTVSSTCRNASVVVGVEYTGLTHVWPTSGLVGSARSGASMVWGFVSGQLGRQQTG